MLFSLSHIDSLSEKMLFPCIFSLYFLMKFLMSHKTYIKQPYVLLKS